MVEPFCKSAPCEWTTTHWISVKMKWESFHVGLGPQPLFKGIDWWQAVNLNFFSWLPQLGPTNVGVMAWWRIRIPIHSIWRLSITLCMFGVCVESIPCGFGASTTAQTQYLVTNSDPEFQPTSKIWANKCWGNGMMVDPYPHPQHVKVVKHLLYVCRICGNHSTWVWSHNHCTRASFSTKQWPKISADHFPNPDPQVWM